MKGPPKIFSGDDFCISWFYMVRRLQKFRAIVQLFQCVAGHRETEPGPADLRKPTFEELSFKLGMTMARIVDIALIGIFGHLNANDSRMQWLHALFETFLPHESGSDVHPTCRYPDQLCACWVK
eukprot:3690484-Amphidinium_carterae.1